MTRRILLMTVAGFLFCPPFGKAAAAAASRSARTLVEELLGAIRGAIAEHTTSEDMTDAFDRIFRQFADTSYIAAYALGVDGRRASPAQKRAYSAAFAQYLSRKYTPRLSEFLDRTITITGTRQERKFIAVECQAIQAGSDPVHIEFHLSNRIGDLRFFNIHVEGLSLLLAERQEMGALLDRLKGDIDALVTALNEMG